jgi:dual specificity protein kinase YAK1
MTGNEDFDLPRWQTQAHLEPLSSSSQAAHPTAQSSYLYSNAPPPPPPQSIATNSAQRQQPPQHSPTTSRGPRISHILEQDQSLANQSSQYLSSGQNNQLARSSSLGGGNSSSRIRRHHQPDDLEGAFNSDTQGHSRQQNPGVSPNSFYSSGTAYQQPSTNNGAPAGGDSYPDMYFNDDSSQKRQATLESTTSSRTPRSPMRSGNTPLLDPYSQQQSQYSPTANSYPYDSSPEHQRTSSSYHSHSRSHSHVKTSPISPPVTSPYSPVQQQHPPPNSGYSSSSYGMGSTSPLPTSQSQSHLSAVPSAQPNSLSTPNTPLSYAHQLSPVSQYYPQDQQMVVELPVSQSTKHRRESGFRRVRDARDLLPYINPQPAGRRMDSSGVFLSVRRFLSNASTADGYIASEAAHN